MKSAAQTKYVLIAVFLAIWSLVIYRTVKGIGGDAVTAPVMVAPAATLKDTVGGYVLLKAPYPDPYVNKIFPGEEAPDTLQVPPHTPPAPASPPQASVTPPPVLEIRYSGYIFNPHTKEKLALLTISGRAVTVGKRDAIGPNLKLIDIQDDRVVLMHNGMRMEALLGR